MLCSEPLQQGVGSVTMLFLCRHVVHLKCVRGGDGLAWTHDSVFSNLSDEGGRQDVGGKIALYVLFPFVEITLKVKIIHN